MLLLILKEMRKLKIIKIMLKISRIMFKNMARFMMDKNTSIERVYFWRVFKE